MSVNPCHTAWCDIGDPAWSYESTRIQRLQLEPSTRHSSERRPDEPTELGHWRRRAFPGFVPESSATKQALSCIPEPKTRVRPHALASSHRIGIMYQASGTGPALFNSQHHNRNLSDNHDPHLIRTKQFKRPESNIRRRQNRRIIILVLLTSSSRHRSTRNRRHTSSFQSKISPQNQVHDGGNRGHMLL